MLLLLVPPLLQVICVYLWQQWDQQNPQELTIARSSCLCCHNSLNDPASSQVALATAADTTAATGCLYLPAAIVGSTATTIAQDSKIESAFAVVELCQVFWCNQALPACRLPCFTCTNLMQCNSLAEASMRTRCTGTWGFSDRLMFQKAVSRLQSPVCLA